jgi:hypothetical protein
MNRRDDNPLVGIWTLDEGFQIVELLFRSDGRYQLDKRSTDPGSDLSSTDRGRYQIAGQVLTLMPYDRLGEPQGQRWDIQVTGDSLAMTTADGTLSYDYRFKPRSREDVHARETVDGELVGRWARSIVFVGLKEYTFRPGGYYLLTYTPEGSQSPPELTRGRYERQGGRMTIKPYGGIEAPYEIDFFGSTLTLIKEEETYGESTGYDAVPGSRHEVMAKAAEAEAFLGRENWQVGLWQIREAWQTVDLTIRPDGRYIAQEETNEHLRGIVRGRYVLEPRRIHLQPFIGQDLYCRSNGEFGKVERTRVLDYYDSELQIIDVEAISQSVTIARKLAGSEAPVMEKTARARLERDRDGWLTGRWEVDDPAGGMAFIFRPDGRYIAMAMTAGVPTQVERGRYGVGPDKVTLAPYAGLGPPRGFALDFYDGDLFLIGDSYRMVIARKGAGSDTVVIEKTRDPESMKGERGSILGRWTANLPGQSAELVFRPDGQFRLTRCVNDAVGQDYGLYAVDMATRTLVSDSRFVEIQTLGLDFYGNTMTIFGGNLGPPSTYTVNPGTVDAAIAASLAADEDEAAIDRQWLARIPVGPRDPDATQIPTADIPADPNPGRIFPTPMVLTEFCLYRRLIPGFVYFNYLGTIRSVAIVNTRAWYFFPTGRVLVRFRNHRAGATYPTTVVDTSDSWGAYRVEPRPEQTDILHLYADNGLLIETDLGERTAMTLEDGRRNLFWSKDHQIHSDWAAERKPTPCQAPVGDPSLINSAVALSTTIAPDPIAAGAGARDL